MCLLTRQICPIEAKEPIMVYKVLWMDSIINNSFLTPWTHTKTGLNKHLVAKGEKTALTHSSYVLSPFKSLRVVSIGYIHCYTNIKDAKLGKRFFTPYNPVYKKVIVKCIIEPGTRYYKSWDGEEIAADSIFIEDIVDI